MNSSQKCGRPSPKMFCVSDDAQRQIRGKVDLVFDSLGPRHLKNIAEAMLAWRVRLDGEGAPRAPARPAQAQPLTLPDKPSIAASDQLVEADVAPQNIAACAGRDDDVIRCLECKIFPKFVGKVLRSLQEERVPVMASIEIAIRLTDSFVRGVLSCSWHPFYFSAVRLHLDRFSGWCVGRD